MIKVIYSGEYHRYLKEFLPTEEMVELVEGRTLLIRKNFDDTHLKNHPLTRRMEGRWSFSITDDIRIIYE